MRKYTTARRGSYNTAEELSAYLLSSLGENLGAAIKACVEVSVRAEMEQYRSKTDEHLVFNGSYGRNLVSTVGKIGIDVPRFRNGNAPQNINTLSVFGQSRASFEEIVSYMHIAGISQRKVDKLSKLVFGKAAPPQTTKRLHEELLQSEAFQINKCSLAGKTWDYYYADGIWFSSLGSLTKKKKDRVALALYGWSKKEGKGTFLGFRIATGESAEEWKQLFSSLKERGFDIKTAPLLSCDGGEGLLSCLEDSAPDAEVQLCLTHRFRNVLCHTKHVHKKEMAADLKKITAASSKEEAEEIVKDMEKKWHVSEPRAVTSLLWNIKRSFTYFSFPKDDWILIRTSNKLERAFREVRRRTVISDNHFQSDESAEKYVVSTLGFREMAVR